MIMLNVSKWGDPRLGLIIDGHKQVLLHH